MTINGNIAIAAAGLALAASAPSASAQTAAHTTATDRMPDVPDGDLGCVVRLSILGYSNGRTIKDPKTSEADRKKAEADDVYVNRDLAFYLGRIALGMPALPLNPTMNAMIEKALAEPGDQLKRETVACDTFQTQTKRETFKALRGK